MNWYITHYYDSDRQAGSTRDYSGAINVKALTYDQHDGLDIALGTIERMLGNVGVYASADGVVEIAEDQHFDRHLAHDSNAQPNLVVLRHTNGFSTSFLHLKKDSVIVAAGDTVKRGDLLGYVGSSGFSDGPHLHIETKDCAGNSFDTIEQMVFDNTPKYKTPPAFYMSYFRTSTPFNSTTDVKSVTTPSIKSSATGQNVYYFAQYVYINKGDQLTEKFYNPSGQYVFQIAHTASATRDVYSSYRKWSHFNLNAEGAWTIKYFVNDQNVGEETFSVQGGF